MLSLASSAVAPLLLGPGYQNESRFISSHQGTKQYDSSGEDWNRESSFLSYVSCIALSALRVNSICQGTLCSSDSPKPNLFFCFALLFKELWFKDEAKLKADCSSVDCVLLCFPFLPSSFSSPAIYFPLCEISGNVRCQVDASKDWQPWFCQSSSNTSPGLSCRILFEINHIYVWEGNYTPSPHKDYWKGFQWTPASIGSSAVWETDWDCQTSFMWSTKKPPHNHKSVTNNLGWISPSHSYSLFLDPQELLMFSGNLWIYFLSLPACFFC